MFGFVDVQELLVDAGGNPGGTVIAHRTVGSIFANRRNLGFPPLPRSACWTNRQGDELMYLNTYMNGERVYAELLFKKGVDPMDERGLSAMSIDSVRDTNNIMRDLRL